MTSPAWLADDVLLERVLAGEEEAFVMLYRRRQGAIYRYALRVSGSAAVAEDVTQDVFLALINGNTRFDRTRGSFASYLYGIARNQVLRRMERDRSYVPLQADPDLGEARLKGNPGFGSDPLGDLTRAERIDSVRQAIVSLPLRYREVLVLCELQELSYAEAGQVIGCPEGTVRSRLHRARTMLAQRLRQARSAASGNLQSARCFA